MTVVAFPRREGLKDELDVLCFSHLRWDFVFQRPQHLMQRFAAHGRVFFIEEPVETDGRSYIDVSKRGNNVFVCVPNLNRLENSDVATIMPGLIDEMRGEWKIENYINWFYTPMMLEWSGELHPRAIIYDCMDELSGFRGAPASLCERERKLFSKADLVFTGGQSLYEAKRLQHSAVYAFPSSIDADHFAKALNIRSDIVELAGIPHPRIGFVGVIDERLDASLLDSIAGLRTDWNFIMVGPVVKIEMDTLPKRANIHYLGQKAYSDLPDILAGWDVAIMPFALNESTRFISPTKTPEYLAAGLPVVSTRITDVVRPYGEMGLVHIADTPDEFVKAIGLAMKEDTEVRRARVNKFLADISWDKTFRAMNELIDVVMAKQTLRPAAGR